MAGWLLVMRVYLRAGMGVVSVCVLMRRVYLHRRMGRVLAGGVGEEGVSAPRNGVWWWWWRCWWAGCICRQGWSVCMPLLVRRVYLHPGMGLCVGWRVYFSTLGLCVCVGALCVWLRVCEGMCSGRVLHPQMVQGCMCVGRGMVLPLGCARVGVGGEWLRSGVVGVQACWWLCV